MTSQGLDKWIWSMLEPIPTWHNFTFVQNCMWTGNDNDQICVPRGQTSNFEQCSNWHQLHIILLLIWSISIYHYLQPPPLFHHENRLFSTAFDTQILAALSGNVAVFPMETIPQDPNYPPAMVRLRQTAKGNPSIYKTWAVTKTKVCCLISV